MLLGRERESAAIRRRLDQAREGRSSSLVLGGDAGIGKTTLLEHAARSASGFSVLRAAGREAESQLAFAALFDLFRPVLEQIDQLPAPQAAALAGALAVGPPVPGDRFTVAAATLSLLAAAAEEQPVLALVDDAQWLDAASREALLFAARRLGEEGVFLLIALREGERDAGELHGLEQLRLDGLDREAAGAILTKESGASVPAEITSKLWEATDGNPLAMIEIMRLLTPGQLRGAEPVEALPAAVAVEEAFLRRVSRLEEPAQRALLVAAAAGSERRSTIDEACRVLGLDGAALSVAERDGLVVSDAGLVRFYHPLVRSAVYRAATEAGRRDVHRALAVALTGFERAWHESEAGAGPDEQLARALEHGAVAATRQNAPELAARSFERAARLTVSDYERGGRLLRAAQQWQLAGKSETALALAGESLRLPHDASRRTELEQLRARAEAARGRLGVASAILLAEAARIEERDGATAVRLMSDACLYLWMGGDVSSMSLTAERCYELGRRVGGESEALAGLAFSGTRFFGGEADRDLLLDTPPLGQDAPQLVHHLAQFYLWLEEFPRARAQVAALSGAAWAASSPSLLAPALSTRSAVLTVYGEWPAAYADACESLRLFEDTGQAAHYPLARAAAIEALRGDEAACTASAERGLFVAEKLGIGSARCYAQAALAQLALGLGRWEEAIGRLLELKTLLYEWGIRHPAVVEWQPDLIEAYVRTGATERAHEELSALELVASRAGNASARAAALRCRGLLAEGDAVDALFLSSLDEQEQLPRPFERARTELCYGERLRRARRKSDARHHLELALRTFEELGARPWAGRARSELQALGIRVPRRASATELELTPQELRVALAVREGATNREASAALFLSPKTIEAHLSSIYRKLGVRSRTELATLLARNETQSADHVLR